MINIGQLLRERHGRVFAVGFGTYEGTVMAGKEWGAVPETMTLPKAVENSWDELMHRAGGDAMFMFPQGGASPLLRTVLGQRAVGVVYRPQFEQYGNYVPTSLSRRYDAYVFVDRTTAVRPLAHAPAFV